LGVLGNIDRLPLIRAAFADSRPKVRKAALLAWVAVSRETADEPTAQSLVDAAPKMVKLAGQLLRKGKVSLSGAQLRWVVEELERRGDIPRLLAFSQRLSYWERLVFLLELLPRFSGTTERQRIADEVIAWLSRQRYSLDSQPVALQERVRLAMGKSGLRDVWRNRSTLVVSLEQFD
jgi:hypothetical protein